MDEQENVNNFTFYTHFNHGKTDVFSSMLELEEGMYAEKEHVL